MSAHLEEMFSTEGRLTEGDGNHARANATENPHQPLMGSSTSMMSITKTPLEGGGNAWIIIVVFLILAVVIFITVFIWKKKQDRKRTKSSPGQGDYSVVQKGGDGKVYSDTTEDIA